MLNLQCCGGGKRLIFCNGVQRYNDFLKLEKFSRFFLKSMVFPKRWGENDQHGEDFKAPHEH